MKKIMSIVLICCILLVFVTTVSASDIIASGQFRGNQDGSVEGATWRLYSNGTLVVDSGFVCMSRESIFGAWFGYHDYIYEVIFTGPITAGSSLSRLFYRLENMSTIYGLYH